MAAMGVYDQIKKAFQDIVAPEIHELRGEIRRLDQKIDGVDARFMVRLNGLDQKIDRQFAWTIGIQVTVLAAVIGALLAR